jgi:hypothetical protein
VHHGSKLTSAHRRTIFPVCAVEIKLPVKACRYGVQKRISEMCLAAGPEVPELCNAHTFGVAAKRADVGG